MRSFLAYDRQHRGGVSVAGGFIDDDKFGDIIVGAAQKQDTGSIKVIIGAGMGGHSHVLMFTIAGGKPHVEHSFLSFQGFNGEASVAGFSGPETE